MFSLPRHLNKNKVLPATASILALQRLISTSKSTVFAQKTSSAPSSMQSAHSHPPPIVLTNGGRMFDKILIANRGEIACRVIRTARKMGVKTVAVYSDADRNSMHVEMADEAYHIGPAPSRESYLRKDRILEIAKQSGAQGIHPGYGFLSENAEFSEYCASNGVVFIGPPASAIRDMGSKSASKIIMSAANVPIIGGYHGKDQSVARLKAEAEKIGYPVLIKAIMGGGGKGMRVVERPEDFEAMLESSKRESMKSFNDDNVLVEKYVLNPRHVEVQVFADTFGNAVYLFERDCSVQRRHQKIIEEAPAPGLSDKVRRELGEAAVRAAKAVNYVGAGTVEFIMDPNQNFFFMEMNTRLQVEHPITEMITGVDLVEWQLKAASGFPIPLKQDDIKINGHAFEARIYAENPYKNFLPGTGPLLFLQTPQPSEDVRVETGVRQGDQVSVFYDPMIAKLVVWDTDRHSSLKKLWNKLHEYRIVGLNTNITFLRDLAIHPAFLDAQVETGFIDKYGKTLLAPRPLPAFHNLAQAALTLAAVDNSKSPLNPWEATGGWRLNHSYEKTLKLSIPIDDDKSEKATIKLARQADDTFVVSISTTYFKEKHEFIGASVKLISPNEVRAVVAGQIYKTTFVTNGNSTTFFADDQTFKVENELPAFLTQTHAADASTSIHAPMTGKVEKVLVQSGQKVEKGAPLVILEAMKMEYVLRAPFSGVIERVTCSSGQLVEQNSLLIAFVDPNKKDE